MISYAAIRDAYCEAYDSRDTYSIDESLDEIGSIGLFDGRYDVTITAKTEIAKTFSELREDPDLEYGKYRPQNKFSGGARYSPRRNRENHRECHDKKYGSSITVPVSDQQKTDLYVVAKNDGITISELVRNALSSYLSAKTEHTECENAAKNLNMA